MSAVTILIDEARWWFRGEKWCHLVSDVSYVELHDFADLVGIPRRSFQGDHYDIPQSYRQQMVDAGALVVESRELVRRRRRSVEHASQQLTVSDATSAGRQRPHVGR
jgi:hypothetical protein